MPWGMFFEKIFIGLSSVMFLLIFIEFCLLARRAEDTKFGRYITKSIFIMIPILVINIICVIGGDIADRKGRPSARLTMEERTQIFGENKVCRQCHKVFKCLEHDENHIVWEWGGLSKSFVCDKCLMENSMNQ